MAQLAIAATGAVLGNTFGLGIASLGLSGAAVGWAAGSLLGTFFTPKQKTQGSRLDDLRVTGTDYGQPIPWVAGSPVVPGQIIWASNRRETAHTEEVGKGGGGAEYTHYTYDVDLLVMLTDNEISGVNRVWINKDVVSLVAGNTSSKFSRMTVYTGTSTQLPDPTYEAAVGTANAPAYRGRACVFIEGLQLGANGQIPQLNFEIAYTGSVQVTDILNQRMQLAGYSADEYDIPSFSSLFGYLNDVTQDYSSEVMYVTQPAKGYNNFDDTSAYQWSRTFPSGAECYITGDGRAYFGTYNSNPIPNYINLGGYGTITEHTGDYTLELAVTFPNNTVSGEYRFCQVGRLVIGFSGGTYSSIYGTTSTTSGGLSNPYGVSGFNGLSTFPTFAQLNNYIADTFGHTDVPIIFIRKGDREQIYFGNLLIKTFTGTSGRSLGMTIINSHTIPSVSEIPYGNPAGYYHYSPFSLSYFRFSKRAIYDIDSKVTPVIYQTNGTRVGDTLEQQRPLLSYTVISTSVEYGYGEGLAISQVAPERNNIEMLQQAFFIETVASDKIYFRTLNPQPVANIPYSDLAASPDGNLEPLRINIKNELEMPSQITIQYMNAEADYQAGSEMSDRLLSDQESNSVIQLPLGLRPSVAKRIANVMVSEQMAKMKSVNLNLSMKYSYLEPTDVITVNNEDNSRQYALKIISKKDSDGIIELECQFCPEPFSTFENNTDENYVSNTTVNVIEPSKIEILDIPVLRDVDLDIGYYSIVVGTGAATDVWTGASTYSSLDDINFNKLGDFNQEGISGVTTNTLSNWTSNTIDFVNTVTVNVGYSVLESSTRDGILSNQSTNLCLIGNELLQFINAELISTGVYKLSGFIRGKKGTEWARSTHTSSDRFVLLKASTVGRTIMKNSYIGVQQYAKAVTFGLNINTATSIPFVCNSINLKPFNPVNLRLNRDTSDIVFSWIPRTKKETKYVGTAGIIIPVSEVQELYRIKVYKNSSLVRTVEVSSPSFSYTSTMQTEDGFVTSDTMMFKVCQLNDVVGEGYPSEIQGVY